MQNRRISELAHVSLTLILLFAIIKGVPLATEPGISLIILTPMKILQRNLNRSTFVVWEMKTNVSVVCVCSRCNILISGKIIKEMPGSVTSGTPGISSAYFTTTFLDEIWEIIRTVVRRVHFSFLCRYVNFVELDFGQLKSRCLQA